MTRSRTRREAEPTSPPQQPHHSHQHEAGGSSWHSASTEEWTRQAPGCRSTCSSSGGAPNLIRRTSSSRGFGAITQQLGELRVQGDNVQETLHQHIETSQARQHHWRETPRHGVVAVAATRGVEGLLPLDGFQTRPAVVSLKLDWGRTPTRGNLYHFFTAFITFLCMKPIKFCKIRKSIKNCITKNK